MLCNTTLSWKRVKHPGLKTYGDGNPEFSSCESSEAIAKAEACRTCENSTLRLR